MPKSMLVEQGHEIIILQLWKLMIKFFWIMVSLEVSIWSFFRVKICRRSLTKPMIWCWERNPTRRTISKTSFNTVVRIIRLFRPSREPKEAMSYQIISIGQMRSLGLTLLGLSLFYRLNLTRSLTFHQILLTFETVLTRSIPQFYFTRTFQIVQPF
jgi:hypothetical protein